MWADMSTEVWGWRGCKLFLGFVHGFSDKTATKLKSGAVVAYKVYVVSLKSSAVHRQ